jgi:hypothetical protein
MLSIKTPSSRPSIHAGRLAAVAVFACVSALGAQAQQAASTQMGAVDTSSLFAANTTRPMDLASLAGLNYSSSSLPDTPDAADPETLNLTSPDSALQPPPRRRYGRPRYNDNAHNADGSSKYTFEAGVGATVPLGNTYHYFNTNYAFQVGGGRQFNKKAAVLLQFDYDRFGVNGPTITNQENLYNNDLGAQVASLDANNHVWSFTLNPTYTFLAGDKYGAYAVVGAGFYHKVTNFTTPEVGTYCDYIYGCYQYEANANIDHYTSNAAGFNGGLGLTYKFSRFADERFFVEARYVFVDNQQRAGVTYADSLATVQAYNGTNYFPANSNKTTYIPVKVGIRF